ncbi:ipa protein [Diplogelasinospora grovesii]|uniref:Ipa protein n=1 Tax=Diplogelasinospora grovesii TaxID=303347 RepID=A0AAN6S4B6_9PEZI|nr:ipa protein [Diplogelasinospora grovesii]
MDDPSTTIVVKELHEDLAQKYRRHAAKVENMWRSFDKNQRTRCLKAGAAEGALLKHPLDRSLGNVYKFIPEWNLRDLTEPGSDILLDILKHRATKTLGEQYIGGVNGGPGDYALIDEMMHTKNLRHVDDFKDCWTFFMDGEEYGASFRILAEHAETLADFAPAIRAGLCIPQSTGELILNRQITLLQSLNILIEDILEEGSQSRSRKQRPKKSDEEAASAALSKLTIKEAPPAKLSLPDLVASARDQKASLEDYLGLLSAEPVVLAHAGRSLPAHTDKYISVAFFDAVHGAVKAAAIWNYIDRLLKLLETSGADKAYRAIILQEISNMCHLEYARAQAVFKRHKWFKRVSNAYDNAGNARVTMKGNPEELTRSDPQLHYMLRLCQPETSAARAADWIKKLGDLYEAHPGDRDKLEEREADSLADLAVIVGFIQDLSPVVSMPSLSRKKGQMFVSRSQDLEAELNQLKKDTQMDLLLRDFAVPIDNLLEPGMAEGALKALDGFVVDKAGTKMGFLYQDLVEDCFSDLQNQYRQVRAKMEEQKKGKAAEWTPPPPLLPVSVPEKQPEKRIAPPPIAAEKTPAAAAIATGEEQQQPAPLPPPPKQIFKVSPSTAAVFSTLLAKSPQSQRGRGSVTWQAFESAMADLGFSVVPKFGSVYTFLPPQSMNADRSLTVHRPHQSRIEGHLVPVFAQRLRRVYGNLQMGGVPTSRRRAIADRNEKQIHRRRTTHPACAPVAGRLARVRGLSRRPWGVPHCSVDGLQVETGSNSVPPG